jgi:hypothetical protein
MLSAVISLVWNSFERLRRTLNDIWSFECIEFFFNPGYRRSGLSLEKESRLLSSSEFINSLITELKSVDKIHIRLKFDKKYFENLKTLSAFYYWTTKKAFLSLDDNNGYAKEQQCYVMHELLIC